MKGWWPAYHKTCHQCNREVSTASWKTGTFSDEQVCCISQVLWCIFHHWCRLFVDPVICELSLTFSFHCFHCYICCRRSRIFLQQPKDSYFWDISLYWNAVQPLTSIDSGVPKSRQGSTNSCRFRDRGSHIYGVPKSIWHRSVSIAFNWHVSFTVLLSIYGKPLALFLALIAYSMQKIDEESPVHFPVNDINVYLKIHRDQ